MKYTAIVPLVALGLCCASGCTNEPPTSAADGGDGWSVGQDAVSDASSEETDTPTDVTDARQPDADADGETNPEDTRDSQDDANTCPADAAYQDCDGDGLTDCEELALGTEVCEADTDGDGLTDLEELENRTNPRDPDSDGDGLIDGRELALELDPRSQATFDDGIIDSSRWFVTACDSPNPKPVDVSEYFEANWQLALPMSVASSRTRLDIAGSTAQNYYAAEVYVDPSNLTAGATLSATPGPAITGPRDKLDQIRDTLDNLADGSGITVTRAEFQTDGAYPTATSHFVVDLAAPVAPSKLRNDLLFAIAPFSRDHVTGLPTPGPSNHTRFRVAASVVTRDYNDGTQQIVTSLGVMEESKYQTQQIARMEFRQMTDGSQLSSIAPDRRTECEVIAPRPTPKVDIYWVIDPSSSMHDEIRELRSASTMLFESLSNMRADVRVGVSTMEQSRQGRLLSPGWHTTAAEFDGALDEILQGPGPTGADDGYETATTGLAYMSNQGSTTPPADETLRRDASVFTIFYGDEEAQTFRTSPLGSNFQQLQTFATELSSYGDIYSVTTEDAASYRFAALLEHGAYAPMGDTELSLQLSELTEEFAGASSVYTFEHRPISNSVLVQIDDNWVPPGRPDGYTLDPARTSIAFTGDSRPYAGDPDIEQGYTVISYDYFDQQTSP